MQRNFLGLGMNFFDAPAERTAKMGVSAGIAIAASVARDVTPVPDEEVKHFTGGLHNPHWCPVFCRLANLIHSQNLSDSNLSIIAEVTLFIMSLSVPFVLLGHFNMLPEVIASSNFLFDTASSLLCPKVQYTCQIGNMKIVDFVVCSNLLFPYASDVLEVPGPFDHHIVLAFSLHIRKQPLYKRVLVKPKALPKPDPELLKTYLKGYSWEVCWSWAALALTGTWGWLEEASGSTGPGVYVSQSVSGPLSVDYAVLSLATEIAWLCAAGIDHKDMAPYLGRGRPLPTRVRNVKVNKPKGQRYADKTASSMLRR